MIVLVTTLSLLGRWQWDVSETRGGLQNLLYAFQWWFVAAMVLYGWARLLHDEAHPREAAAKRAAKMRTTGTGPVSVPAGESEPWAARVSTSDLIEAQLATADTGATPGESDAELADYNQYLAWLNERAQRAR
jgi:DNA-binding transcriptional regulator of glucitol operon